MNDSSTSMLAIVPVRGGELCVGGAEAAAEAAGRVLLIGSGTGEAVTALAGIAAAPVETVEEADFAPGAWAAVLQQVLAEHHASLDVIVIPAAPDGRDLAPRLAARLDLPLVAGAVEVEPGRAQVPRWGGQVLVDVAIPGPAVVTLEPGARGAPEPTGEAPATVERRVDAAGEADEATGRGRAPRDAETLEVLPPDVTTMDLGEARRIVGGGAGLRGADDFAALHELATALGASMGATRVVTDAGWVPHERQIGTTGVVVDPRLYLAFGISGAVQHTAGLGSPEHIVSVNLDPHCPMMALADLAVVADAPAVVRALRERLGRESTDD